LLFDILFNFISIIRDGVAPVMDFSLSTPGDWRI